MSPPDGSERGPARPAPSLKRPVASHVAAAIGRTMQAKPIAAAVSPVAPHVAVALGLGAEANTKSMPGPAAAKAEARAGVLQRAEKWVPPHKRPGYVPSTTKTSLKKEEGRPLYDWLNSDASANLSVARIVNQKGDYVTLELTQKPVIRDHARTLQFNVHHYSNSQDRVLGSIWAMGVYNCEVSNQDNPRRYDLLKLWVDLFNKGDNPQLEPVDGEFMLFSDAKV